MPLVPGRCYLCLSIGNFKLRESGKWWTNNSDHNQKNKTRMVMLQLNFKKKNEIWWNVQQNDSWLWCVQVMGQRWPHKSTFRYLVHEQSKLEKKRNVSKVSSSWIFHAVFGIPKRKLSRSRKISCYSYCTGWFIGFLIYIQFRCSLHPKKNNHQPQDGPSYNRYKLDKQGCIPIPI